MDSQDVITYTQKIVKVIEDDKTAKVIRDENLFPVLKYLQKGPMTIMDLVAFFKKSGEKKSDKTKQIKPAEEIKEEKTDATTEAGKIQKES